MLELVRDPFWQFVGAVLPVLVIVIQLRRKGLSYHVLEDLAILTIDETITTHVNVRFDGKPIGTLRGLKIRLINVGTLPVKPTDYESPIILEFSKGAQVLKANVGEMRPTHLRPKVTVTRNRVLLNPLLLQHGEYITLTVLVSAADGPVRVLSRIIGIKEITNYLSSESCGWYRRQVQGREFKELFKAWSIFPVLFGLMGLLGMLQVRGGGWVLLWLGFSAVWYLLLALLVALALAAVPVLVRPLKRAGWIRSTRRVMG